MEALDTRKMETDDNSSGALGAGEHGGGSHQLQSPGSNPPTLTLAEFLLEIQRICASPASPSAIFPTVVVFRFF